MSSHVYASGGPGKTFDITTFFTQNSLPAGCTLSCSIGDTCGSSLTGSQIGQASVSTPWTFTALEDVVIGYDKTACYRCTSGSTNFDKTFQIVQNGDCSTSLTPKTIATPLSSHVYASGGLGKTFDITTFFTQNTLP